VLVAEKFQECAAMNLPSLRNVDRTRGNVIPEPRWNQPRDCQNKFETFGLLENLIELAIMGVTMSRHCDVLVRGTVRPAPVSKTSHDRSFEWET
jgi:hypothetical protein